MVLDPSVVVVQIAVDRLVDARWSDEIHDEWIRNLVAGVPGIPVERSQITRKLMNDALPHATFTGYQAHLEAVTLPDPDDRYVVAVAIAARIGYPHLESARFSNKGIEEAGLGPSYPGRLSHRSP